MLQHLVAIMQLYISTYFELCSLCGLKFETKAHETFRIDSTGWIEWNIADGIGHRFWVWFVSYDVSDWALS